MKAFLVLSLVVALTLAEPPRYRQQSQFERQRYYVERPQDDAEGAGYAPSGWRPQGPAFNLPQRQYGAPTSQQQYGTPTPQQQYGTPTPAPQQNYGAPTPAPQQTYGNPVVPQREYGAPDDSTTESPNDEEEPTTVRSLESEQMNAANELEDDIDAQQPQQTGEYYVALPDGRLQRVRYVSRQDVEAMKYFAKIRAENVEPLRGPIYAYAPLKRLEVSNEKLVEVQPIAQIQYQVENPSRMVPVSSSLTTYTANYKADEPRYILTL